MQEPNIVAPGPAPAPATGGTWVQSLSAAAQGVWLRLPGLAAAGRIGIFGLFLIVLAQILNLSPIRLYRWAVPPKGYIFVDSPEVYTRERLINERSSEEAWLTKKLEEADDDKSLAGLSRLVEKRLQLGADGQPPASPAGQSGSKDGAGTAQPTPDTSYLSFDQKVRIQDANRNLILQKIVENRLDDRHDLDGNSLYILKFDTTVVTNEYSKRKAIVGIQLVPPFPSRQDEPDGGGAKNSPFPADLLNDTRTVSIIRNSFENFQRDAATRLNRTVARLMRERPEVSDPGKIVKSAAAREFGVDESELRLKLNTFQGTTGSFGEMGVSIDSLNSYMSFISVFRQGPIAVPPSFGAQPVTFNFEIVQPGCTRPAATTVNTPGYGFKTQFDLAGAVHLSGYLDAAGAKNGPRPTLYATVDGYQMLNNIENITGFLTLLDRSLKDTPGVGDVRQNTLLTMYFKSLAATETDKDGHQKQIFNTDDALRTTCRVITGSLRTGLINFVNKVRQFNSYGYSALPRQSAVAVVDDIIESIAARFPGSQNAGSLLEGFGFGAATSSRIHGGQLRSRVISFGELGSGAAAHQGDLSVGWIIDPNAARISGAADETISTAESIMAIVSVPSWWPFLRLKIKREWLDVDGKRIPAELATDEDATTGGSTSEGESEFLINLPNSQHQLEGTIINNDRRKPSIDNVFCEARKTTTRKSDDGKQQPVTVPTCVIEGTRLWRNPVVLSGSARNRTLTVLPDMKGLLVEFDEDVDPCSAALWVWTSEGVAKWPRDACAKPSELSLQTTE